MLGLWIPDVELKLTLWGVAAAENTGSIFLLVPTRSNKLYQQVLLRPCPCLLWFLDSSLPGMPIMVKNIMGSLLRCWWHSFGGACPCGAISGVKGCHCCLLSHVLATAMITYCYCCCRWLLAAAAAAVLAVVVVTPVVCTLTFLQGCSHPVLSLLMIAFWVTFGNWHNPKPQKSFKP